MMMTNHDYGLTCHDLQATNRRAAKEGPIRFIDLQWPRLDLALQGGGGLMGVCPWGPKWGLSNHRQLVHVGWHRT